MRPTALASPTGPGDKGGWGHKLEKETERERCDTRWGGGLTRSYATQMEQAATSIHRIAPYLSPSCLLSYFCGKEAVSRNFKTCRKPAFRGRGWMFNLTYICCVKFGVIQGWFRSFLSGPGPSCDTIRNADLRLRSNRIRIRNTDLRLRFYRIRIRNTDLRLRSNRIRIRNTDLRLRSIRIRILNNDLRWRSTPIRIRNTDLRWRSNRIRISNTDLRLRSSQFRICNTDFL